jgi:hypothetical protein
MQTAFFFLHSEKIRTGICIRIAIIAIGAKMNTAIFQL